MLRAGTFTRYLCSSGHAAVPATRLTPAQSRRNLDSKPCLWISSKKSCACDVPASAAPSPQSFIRMARFQATKARVCSSATTARSPVRLAAAKDVIQKEQPRKMTFNLNHEAAYDAGLICGGTLEIFVEPILPQPILYLFGAGHVSTAVARVAHQAGF